MSNLNELERQIKHDEFRSTNEKTMDAATIALKSALLINGGAAVAVLGFVASIYGSGVSSELLLAAVAIALMYFAWGVFSAVAAMCFAYLTNNALLGILSNDIAGESRWPNSIIYKGFMGLSFVFTFASVVLFVLGAYEVKTAVIEASSHVAAAGS